MQVGTMEFEVYLKTFSLCALIVHIGLEFKVYYKQLMDSYPAHYESHWRILCLWDTLIEQSYILQ